MASTLFYHLSSLRFTSSQFSPTSIFASASASASARACFHHYQLSVRSTSCCIHVPPSIGHCHCTGMTALYRYLPTLLCWSKPSETEKNYAVFGRRSSSLLPSYSDASSSIFSSFTASSVSSASSDYLFSSPSLPPLSHLSASEPPPLQTASRSTYLSLL